MELGSAGGCSPGERTHLVPCCLRDALPPLLGSDPPQFRLLKLLPKFVLEPPDRFISLHNSNVIQGA